jgi:hypothetical protein
VAGNIKFSIVGTDRFTIFVSVARVNNVMLNLCSGRVFTLDREVIITSKIRTVIQVVRRGYPQFLSVMPTHELRSDRGSMWLLLMLDRLFYTISVTSLFVSDRMFWHMLEIIQQFSRNQGNLEGGSFTGES